MDLSCLKTQIETTAAEAQATLNDLLLDEWDRAGIRFEQATWDSDKGKEGKPKKRKLRIDGHRGPATPSTGASSSTRS